ncbi:MAG TPA: alpha/beta hydrolase [Longilinea sp.]|nr:alpha/beta hydrolase [Longilinea sp.]
MTPRSLLTYYDNLHLAYAEYGDPHGYPLLIQHGLIASIDDFDLFDDLIRAGARLICIARPGYGRSSPYEMRSFGEWGDIIALLVRELGLIRFDVLGMSSGAPYSYAIAARMPEAVRNVFIFSGVPAFYDETVRSQWPHPLTRGQSMAEMQDLAHQLFFSNLSADDLRQNDVRDSRMNNGFGVAQDLRLRAMDWDFTLADVKAQVFMRHSKTDDNVPYGTAVRTAELLPDCQLELLESGPHFSAAALADFIEQTILPHLVQ